MVKWIVLGLVGLLVVGMIAAANDDKKDSTTSASSQTGTPRLDAAGSNACYLFGTFAADATTMAPSEVHAALKRIYFGAGGFGGRGAKNSSNLVIKRNARRMLEIEVSQGVGAAWLRAASRFGNECERFA